MAKSKITQREALRKALTSEFVRRILFYNKKTGLFRWRINRKPRGKKGAVAGCLTPEGYIIIGIGGICYFAHRLAWFYVTKRWPKEQIDHKNQRRCDNRWHNLREATHAENLQNHGYNKNNTCGYKGIYKRKDCNRWCAMIGTVGKTHYLGLFKTREEAIRAWRTAAKKFHGTFACY